MENNEFELMRILGTIQADVAATKTAVENLSGPEGRVTKVEERIQTAENRQWWHTAAILPITVSLHALLKKFGVTP